MRIGVDGRVLTDHYPGIGRAVYSILPSLAADADTIVLIRGPEPESDWFPISPLTERSIEIHRVSAGLRSIGEQFHPPATASDPELDVVLTPYFATTLRWPCPRVTMVHDVIPLMRKGGMTSLVKRVGYRLFLRATLLHSQMVVTPSQATAKRLLRFAPGIRSRTRVIPHSVEQTFRPKSPSEVSEVRHRYQIGGYHVLTVAGDRPHKNLSRLADAWAALDPDARGDAVLAMVGSPPPQIDHPTIRVLGAVPDDDLQALYAGATMAVVPSLAEGFGLPVAEALVYGTPVVCSDIQVFHELAGNTAIFFDPTDQASLGRSLERMLTDDDLRHRLRRRGPDRVARFAPPLVATDLLETLRTAASAGA